MTVRDEGEFLAINFGYDIFPLSVLPFTHEKICYADIISVQQGRIWIINGCGLHYVPFLGTIYNIWGFRCVKLILNSSFHYVKLPG